MQTKLTRFADGLMEAVWLAAVIIVPVYFNIYSSRIFEPDKIALLRSLTLIGLAAWIAKAFALGGVDWGRLQGDSPAKRLRNLLKTPLVPAVLSLAAVYVIATVFSVTPRISLFGSYQRLQGAYTTFSYLILFSMVAVHMRRREQVDRLITTAILTSLPVGLYGILQRYEIDPIPWGGETAKRVAANLGNAIFVAAYLIVAVPLTLGRIVDSFTSILDEGQTNLGPQIARGSVYVFTAAIQLIGIYFSLSRGPILGLLAGIFFLFLLLSLYWGKRRLTIATIGAAAALGAFLVLLSIPGGPFERLRSNETIGRIGNVFQTESGTGKVRVLIWEGAAQLVSYHEPIEYPDGNKDAWNFLRPFIGYGPESMYVAYNSFYPPELADIEARNASPDRSHNETWDALVITGVLGLAAEQAVFVSAFYYGLKWLGLLSSERQRRLFFGLIAAGGLLSSLAFIFLIDIGFLGVGLPFGMLIGLLVYLAVTSIFFEYRRPETEAERARSLTLMMLLGAIIAHYVEVHFGIAISATRLYFWVLSGALLAVGFWMTHAGKYGSNARAVLAADLAPGILTETAEEPAGPSPAGKKSKRKSSAAAPRSGPAWIGGLSAGILLATLTYDYFTNSTRLTSIGGIIRRSLTVMPGPDGDAASFGVLAIFLTAWLAWSIITAAETAREDPAGWRRVLISTAGISLLIWFVYATLHAGSLVGVIQAAADGGARAIDAQATGLERTLTRFYIVITLLVIFLGSRLAGDSETWRRLPAVSGASLAVSAVLGAAALAGAWQLNLRVIHADIVFKVAEGFSRAGTRDGWQIALDLYKRANGHAPQEDYYYLFLGKAYLELSRLTQNEDPIAVRSLLAQAENDLLRAQRINPLNTDHTANLARLYRFWANVPGVIEDPDELLQRSAGYYERALVLSPNNSVIWNELGLLYLNELGDAAQGLELLGHSIEIDPFYDGTYALLGDYYAAQARAAGEEEARREAAGKAAGYYTQALAETKNPAARYLYAAALGGVHVLVDDLPAAVNAYLLALENVEEDQRWVVESTLAEAYAELDDFVSALEYANLAWEHAPEVQKPAQQELIAAIEEMQSAP